MAIARVTQNETIHNQGMEFRQDLMGAFAKPKDMLKGRSLYLNGQVVSDQEGWRLVPQVKAEKVFML